MENIIYKNHTIRFEESTGQFKLLIDGEVFYRNESINEVKKQVDRLVKKGFKRIPVLIKSYGDEFCKADITSIGEDGSIWIVKKNGCREKIGGWRLVYKDSKENNIIVNQINELAKETKRLDSEKDKLVKKLKFIERKSNI